MPVSFYLHRSSNKEENSKILCFAYKFVLEILFYCPTYFFSRNIYAVFSFAWAYNYLNTRKFLCGNSTVILMWVWCSIVRWIFTIYMKIGVRWRECTIIDADTVLCRHTSFCSKLFEHALQILCKNHFFYDLRTGYTSQSMIQSFLISFFIRYSQFFLYYNTLLRTKFQVLSSQKIPCRLWYLVTAENLRQKRLYLLVALA